MNQDPFKEYIKQSELNKRDKGYAWSTAIGLQAVDGLEPSEQLVKTAIENIEGYITMEDKALAAKKSSKVLENASSNGAECLITACPLCLYNLNKNGKIASGKELPVYYLTTLLAAALGNADAVKALENASKADCGCCCNGGK